MDINIEAPGHHSQEALIEYYTERLNRKYGGYDFIKTIDVKVKKEVGNKYEVNLRIGPEKGTFLFSSDTDSNENKALTEAIRKMNVQIEKYKQHHYHNVHTVDKDQRFPDTDNQDSE